MRCVLILVAFFACRRRRMRNPQPSPSSCWARAPTAGPWRWRAPSSSGRRRCPVLQRAVRRLAGDDAAPAAAGRRISALCWSASRSIRRARRRRPGRRPAPRLPSASADAAPRAGDGRQRLPWRSAAQAATLRRRRLHQDLAVRRHRRGREAARPDLIIHVGDYNYRNTPRDMVLSRSVTGYARRSRSRSSTLATSTTRTSPKSRSGRPIGARTCRAARSPTSGRPGATISSFPALRLMRRRPGSGARQPRALQPRRPGLVLPARSRDRRCSGGRACRPSCPPQTPAGWQPGAWPTPGLPFDGQPFPVRLSAADAPEARRARHHLARFGQCRRCLPLQPRRLRRAIPARRRHPGRAPADLAGHPSAVLGRGEEDQGRLGGQRALRLHQRHPAAAAGEGLPNGLPSNVTAVMAGHMHRFQAIGFGDRRPPQLIVGTGGIVLSHVQPVPPSPDDKRPILVPNSTASMPRWSA